MKALVTGSNGFIGFNLCKALRSAHYDVLGVDDLSSGLRENTCDGFHYKWIQIQERRRIEKILGDFRPDIVFHLAAVPRVSYSVENPFLTAEANVMGTISLLEGIVKAGLSDRTRFVNSSSSSVYGGAAVLPTPESHPCHPKSPYALEKHHGELWCRLFADLYGVDVVSLRYFNVFGPHALFGGAYSTVLAAWLYHLCVDSTYEPFLEGDGSQTRDFCYVDNVVQANLLAAERGEGFKGEVFNVAQGHSYSLLECRDMLEEICQSRLLLQGQPPRTGDVKHTLADISAARNELGYDPATDFFGQLTMMAEWYRTSYPRAG